MSVATVLLLMATSVLADKSTLSGQVKDAAGEPIAGAVVDLYTAKPRVGLAVTCPSCYRDCAKSTKTDSQGRFSIDQLDSGLLFRVLVMAPGRRAKLTDLIDPAQTELEVKLESLPTNLPIERMLKGRVLDEQGKPLAGAIVSPTGAKTRDKRWWGLLPGVDESAVTDAEGRFVITSQDSKLGLDLSVSAPGFAVHPAQLFDLDGTEHEIRMRLGASVSGRLVYEGKPVSNRAIGVVQTNRSPESFVGEQVLATDDNGRFLLADLQPNEPYVLYTLCDASQDLPVLKTVSLKTGAEGDDTHFDELKLVPGLTLTGRVEFPSGSKIPDGAKLRLSRDPAWDWSEALLSGDGEFTIRSLPAEVYTVSVIAPGFELDPSQMRFQVTGATEFAMRLRGGGQPVIRIAVPMKSK